MDKLFDRIEASVAALKKRMDFVPDIGIILGTGLGKLAGQIDKAATVEYKEIPHFPLSTVEFHAGKLHLGTLAGKKVVAMEGRFHFYEGYSLKEITYPVRVLKALGIKALIVSNACGGISRGLHPGDIMIIRDHINLLGQTPLIGENDSRLGPRFPDLFHCYTPALIDAAEAAARGKKIDVKKGVYAIMPGPCLETPAEYRMLKTLGADVVGMSTVPEVIVAAHAGLQVLGLSVVTDDCDPDTVGPVDIEKIIATANAAESRLISLIEGVLARM